MNDAQTTTKIITSHENSPILLSAGAGEVWLRRFFQIFPAYVPHDDLGTNYVSCGVILLTSVLTRDRNRETLGRITGLPAEFAEVVVSAADSSRFWESDHMKQFAHEAWGALAEPNSVNESLLWILEKYWDAAWSEKFIVDLQAARKNRLVGGHIQGWEDLSFDADYGSGMKMRCHLA